MISIIICTYNRERFLPEALERVAANAYPDYEIILVDNNSTDSTAAICNSFGKKHPEINFRYFMEEKQGLSHARNRGIAESRGEYLVFLDDDSMIGADYLHNLSRNLSRHNEPIAFGGKITPRFESTIPDWLCKWSLSWVSGLDMGDGEKEFAKGYPIGANMGMSRKIIDDCGVFNVNLGRSGGNMMGGEEKDIFNRIKAKGYRIIYFPDISIEHVIPEHRTTREYVERLAHGIGMSERSRTLSLKKGAFFKRLFDEAIKWCGTIVLSAGYLLQNRPSCAKMLIVFRLGVTRGLLKQ